MKEWSANFEAEHGIAPTVEDKATISDRYLAYKMVEHHSFCIVHVPHCPELFLQLSQQLTELKEEIKDYEKKKRGDSASRK